MAGLLGKWARRGSKSSRGQMRLGSRGEKLARKYLCRQGWRHVASNYAGSRGEIDLIMQEGATIVFVEVKTRQSEDFTAAEQVVNQRKRDHIAATAREFIEINGLSEYPCRFDVAVVVFDERGKAEVRHQAHAFSARG